MTATQRRRPGAGRPAENTDPTHTFGPWLLDAIQERGMNQAEFAEKAGVSATTVSRWRNVRTPAGKYLQRIADVLRLDYDFVATRAGYRPEHVGSTRNPGTPEGEIVTRVENVRWTEERLKIVRAVLDTMIEIDES